MLVPFERVRVDVLRETATNWFFVYLGITPLVPCPGHCIFLFADERRFISPIRLRHSPSTTYTHTHTPFECFRVCFASPERISHNDGRASIDPPPTSNVVRNRAEQYLICRRRFFRALFARIFRFVQPAAEICFPYSVRTPTGPSH